MRFTQFWALRAPADDENTGTGTGEGEGSGKKTTFNINGKEVDPATAAAALNLYNSLADPETGKEIIEQLARRTGILKDADTKLTEKEQTKLEGKFTKLMKAKLGKDYDKFSDALGPVFDEGLQAMLDELKEEIRGGGEASNWETVVENFFEANKTTPDLEKEMERIIKRNGGRPSGLKGKAAKEYLQDMYELAAHKLNLNIKTLKKVGEDDDDTLTEDEEDQLVLRRGKRGNRGRSRDEIPEFREVTRPKGPLSIDDIVEAASKGIRFKAR